MAVILLQSGKQLVGAAAETDLLDVDPVSDKLVEGKLIVGTLEEGAASVVSYRIYFNDLMVMIFSGGDLLSAGVPHLQEPTIIPLMIPPSVRFRVSITTSQSMTSAEGAAAMFQGREVEEEILSPAAIRRGRGTDGDQAGTGEQSG